MRGSSALDALLAEFPDRPLRVHVIWEPVLTTDVAPPLSGVLANLKDRRVVQYWDPERVVSADIVRAVNENPARYGFDEPLPPDFVAWDLVAVFGPDARWEPDLPVPDHYDGPVLHAIDSTRKALTQASSPE